MKWGRYHIKIYEGNNPNPKVLELVPKSTSENSFSTFEKIEKCVKEAIQKLDL